MEPKRKKTRAQRDWIVTLERRLQTALNEVMELRGEGDDETV
jgi:hypothetical protein